jgi:phosphate/phosphite/phosphonate ABC transporter binding protein
MQTRILLAGALAALGCCHCHRRTTTAETPAPAAAGRSVGERPRRLILGLTPFLPPEVLRREFEPLADYLAEEVGIAIDLRPADSYADLSHLLRTHQVHLAQLSPYAYVRARQENPDLTLLATQISDGSSTYAAYIVARANSRFNSPLDLRGRRFAFVDRHSASGYLYPMAYLQSLNIDPKSFFGKVVFAGNHRHVTEMIINGEVDAGATLATAMKMADPDGAAPSKLKILAKTGRVPLDAFCALGGLDPDVVAQVRAALLSLNTQTERGRRILGGMIRINGFVEAADSHWDEVRRVVQIVKEPDEAAP